METEYNPEKNPERKYNPRKLGRLRKAVIGTAAGLALLVGGAGISTGMSGCNFTPQESDKKVRDYLEQEYTQLVIDDKANKSKFKKLVQEHGDFIREYLPYVNIDNPSERDKIFVTQFPDWNTIESYMKIDTRNLTKGQKEALEEFNSRKLTEQDIGYIKQVPWMDLNNLSIKDKIWLIENARATQIGYEINHNSTNRTSY